MAYEKQVAKKSLKLTELYFDKKVRITMTKGYQEGILSCFNDFYKEVVLRKDYEFHRVRIYIPFKNFISIKPIE